MVTRAQTTKMVENKMDLKKRMKRYGKGSYGNPFSAGSSTVKKQPKKKYGAPKKKKMAPAQSRLTRKPNRKIA
jgi:hypothetical protein